MTSRDRQRDVQQKELLEEALAEFLRKHPGLREWNERRPRAQSEAALPKIKIFRDRCPRDGRYPSPMAAASTTFSPGNENHCGSQFGTLASFDPPNGIIYILLLY